MITSNQSTSLILADTHVHFYDCFDVNQVLSAASKNFQTFAHQSNAQNNYVGVLFLTETNSENYFHDLYLSASSKSNPLNCSEAQPRWIFLRTQESYSLITQYKTSDQQTTSDQLVLLAGRQIVTAEKLEVLALISDGAFADGMPLAETIAAILAADGIPVLPWGMGKWIGKRGKLLQTLLQNQPFPVLFLGDNGGRPIFWLRSPYFRQAEAQGLRVLPGTDPLPLLSEYQRPGSFGLQAQGTLSRRQPGHEMKQLLLNASTPISTYGSLETPFRFVRNQLQLRSRKPNHKFN